MRQNVRNFVKIVRNTIPFKQPVVEFGSQIIPGQEKLANLRPLFKGMDYIGTDMEPGKGVDMVLDLERIDLPSRSVGLALCLDTLEHVKKPEKAVRELHKILRKDGVLVISSVMNFPIHNYPSDYWRFTPMAFELLLSKFSSSFVTWQGDNTFPHTVIGIGFKGDLKVDKGFEREHDKWSKNKRLGIGSFVPPVMYPMIREMWHKWD